MKTLAMSTDFWTMFPIVQRLGRFNAVVRAIRKRGADSRAE